VQVRLAAVDWLNAARCRGDGPPFFKLGRLVKYVPDVVDDWARKSARQLDERQGLARPIEGALKLRMRYLCALGRRQIRR
jgi:hypothetical protein